MLQKESFKGRRTADAFPNRRSCATWSACRNSGICKAKGILARRRIGLTENRSTISPEISENFSAVVFEEKKGLLRVVCHDAGEAFFFMPFKLLIQFFERYGREDRESTFSIASATSLAICRAPSSEKWVSSAIPSG